MERFGASAIYGWCVRVFAVACVMWLTHVSTTFLWSVRQRVHDPNARSPVLLQDLSSTGATTGNIRTDVEIKSNMICGASGLATFVASDVPTGIGRTTRRPGAPRADSPSTPRVDSGDVPAAVEANSALTGLPPAGGAYQEYKDEGEVRQLLAADYGKLLTIGAMDKRFGECVSFKFTGKAAARAVCVLPSSNNPWLRMQLISNLHLAVGDAPLCFADLGSGAGARARRGDVIFRTASQTSKHARSQKGTLFFQSYFNDLGRAAEAWKEEIHKPVAVLFVDLHCWAGDSVEAFPRNRVTLVFVSQGFVCCVCRMLPCKRRPSL